MSTQTHTIEAPGKVPPMKRRMVIPGVNAEYDVPKDIIVCEPSDEMFFAALRAKGALYEGSFSPSKAREEHRAMVSKLRETGAEVYDLRKLMLQGLIDEAGSETRRLEQLRELTFHSNQYNYDREIGLEDRIRSEIDRKNDIMQQTPEELVRTLFLQPQITVKYSPEGNVDTVNETTVEPVYNITFMRDQMITTPKGIVLGKMNSRQRRTETLLVKFALGGLEIEPILEIEGEGRLEGGDYLPTADRIRFAGGDGEVVYLGNGLRSNKAALEQLLEQYDNVFGEKILAVVTDPKSDQDHMHLDTYMNILGPKQVLIDESRYDAPVAEMPKVRIYKAGPDGKGVPVAFGDGSVEKPIKEYFTEQGISIVPVTSAIQAAYGVNFLTTGAGRFIGVDIGAKDGFKRDMIKVAEQNAGLLLDFFPSPREVDYQGLFTEYKARLARGGVTNGVDHFLMYNNLNQAYGSVHCLTQVIRRETK